MLNFLSQAFFLYLPKMRYRYAMMGKIAKTAIMMPRKIHGTMCGLALT